MKKNILLLFCACALTWTSCTDTVDYTAAGAVEGQGVYFPTSVVTSYEVEGVSGEITLDVNRTYSEQAYEAALNATFSEGGESVFNVPATVAFEAGSNTASVTLSYNNLVRGQEYTVSLAFADATPYSNSAIQLSVLYPNEEVLVWKVVSEDAVLIDNMFNMLIDNEQNSLGNYAINDITVEQAEGKNLIRFKSPYNNEYFKERITGEDNFFGADFEAPYIILDGEIYKSSGSNMWYIAPSSLGFRMDFIGNSVDFSADPEWNTFGSVAGNLGTASGPIQPGDSQYPLGSYDEKSKCFDFGAVYHYIGGDKGGYSIISAGTFKLYLDPTLMAPDYNRDYTWVDVEGSEGEYISELAGESAVTTLQQAKEDKTFYRIPDLYAEGYPLYFNLDKEAGTVSIPTEIPIETGMTVLGGNKVYVKGAAGKSSYNAETGVINLGLVFYLADAEGNETAELATSNDVFVWGKSGVELFKAGVSIDEYVGNWGMTINAFMNDGSMAPVDGSASIAKSDNSTLNVSGIMASLGVSGYDDTFKLSYSSSTGLLEFTTQDVAPYANYNTFVGLTDLSYIADAQDKLIGGISIIDGNLKFINNADNSYQWPYMTYAVTTNMGIQFLGGVIELDWTAIKSEAAATSTQSVEPMIFKPSDIRQNEKELNVELYRPTKSNSSKSGLKLKASALQNISNFSLAK